MAFSHQKIQESLFEKIASLKEDEVLDITNFIELGSGWKIVKRNPFLLCLIDYPQVCYSPESRRALIGYSAFFGIMGIKDRFKIIISDVLSRLNVDLETLNKILSRRYKVKEILYRDENGEIFLQSFIYLNVSFNEMKNAIQEDEEIRTRYQIWE